MCGISKNLEEEFNRLIIQQYQVNVVLWEGRHFCRKKANYKVIISIGKIKKKIYSKKCNTECLYFNNYCIFPFKLPLNALLDKILQIKLYKKSARKLIGSFKVELATVWSQPNHQFYHKWAVLVDPRNPSGCVKGFIKCDIVILSKNITAKNDSECGDGGCCLEDNLLIPYGRIKNRIRTLVLISVYRADSFSPKLRRKLHLFRVKITYGGIVRQTSLVKSKNSPVWNEELIFHDLFPPLMQNLVIEICDKKKSLGNTTIDTRTLYENDDNGFLPTFGPNFLYLYEPLGKYNRHRNSSPADNSFTYAARLLLSLRTEVIQNFDIENIPNRIGPQKIPPIIENMCCEYNNFILFAAIFDVLVFDAKPVKIKIQLTMGPKKIFKCTKRMHSKKKCRRKTASECQRTKRVLKGRRRRKLQCTSSETEHDMSEDPSEIHIPENDESSETCSNCKRAQTTSETINLWEIFKKKLKTLKEDIVNNIFIKKCPENVSINLKRENEVCNVTEKNVKIFLQMEMKTILQENELSKTKLISKKFFDKDDGEAEAFKKRQIAQNLQNFLEDIFEKIKQVPVLTGSDCVEKRILALGEKCDVPVRTTFLCQNTSLLAVEEKCLVPVRTEHKYQEKFPIALEEKCVLHVLTEPKYIEEHSLCLEEKCCTPVCPKSRCRRRARGGRIRYAPERTQPECIEEHPLCLEDKCYTHVCPKPRCRRRARGGKIRYAPERTQPECIEEHPLCLEDKCYEPECTEEHPLCLEDKCYTHVCPKPRCRRRARGGKCCAPERTQPECTEERPLCLEEERYTSVCSKPRCRRRARGGKKCYAPVRTQPECIEHPLCLEDKCYEPECTEEHPLCLEDKCYTHVCPKPRCRRRARGGKCCAPERTQPECTEERPLCLEEERYTPVCSKPRCRRRARGGKKCYAPVRTQPECIEHPLCLEDKCYEPECTEEHPLCLEQKCYTPVCHKPRCRRRARGGRIRYAPVRTEPECIERPLCLEKKCCTPVCHKPRCRRRARGGRIRYAPVRTEPECIEEHPLCLEEKCYTPVCPKPRCRRRARGGRIRYAPVRTEPECIEEHPLCLEEKCYEPVCMEEHPLCLEDKCHEPVQTEPVCMEEHSLCSEEKCPEPVCITCKRQPLQCVNVITNYDSTIFKSCTCSKGYRYVKFYGNIPCVNIFGKWPNSLNRMYCSNVIKKAVKNWADEINNLKDDLQSEPCCCKSPQMLKDTLTNLYESCESILFLTEVINLDETELCRQRKRYYDKKIANIAQKLKASTRKPLKPEQELNKITTYLAKLTKYAQDPENSFPHTEIWLLSGNQKLAQHRIKTEDVVYSENCDYRGIMSGKTQTILCRTKKGKIKAKLEILIWFGLAENFNECLKILPDGCCKKNIVYGSLPDVNIPYRMVVDEEHYFQCKMHIYQGKIFFGFDSSGLTSTFVRVIFQGQNNTTKIRSRTLNPIWDETLIFHVTLYGSCDFIKENPPCVTVEVFGGNRRKKFKPIGRCFISPIIDFNDDCSPPTELKWVSVMSECREVGQILIAGELLKIFCEFATPVCPFSVPIPDCIRPHNVKYRLEVLFWGVRPMMKLSCLKNDLFVVLECGESFIKSPVLKKVRCKLNFPCMIREIVLNLPEEIIYAPGLNVRLFYTTSITHTPTYLAICVVPNIRFILVPKKTCTCFDEEEEEEIEEEDDDEKTGDLILENIKKETKICLESINQFWGNILKKWLKMLKNTRICFQRKFSGFEYTNKLVTKPLKFDFIYDKPYLLNAADSSIELCNSCVKSDDCACKGLNWWTRYRLSEECKTQPQIFPRIKIYKEELESQPEFNGFEDFLQNYVTITQQKKCVKEVAKVKIALKFQKCTPEPEKGFLLTSFTNCCLKFVVRVYVISGKNLANRRKIAKSNPYLFLQLGKKCINDKKCYVPQNLNPIFGKCYEICGVFPQDYLLRIKVLDRKIKSKDELIGETSIDLENRFYSKYHATCGIASCYVNHGCNKWRDMYRPSEILQMLCDQMNFNEPIFEKKGVVIEGYCFKTPVPDNEIDKIEVQSLIVLKNWCKMPCYGFHFVPEHVEERSLYHPELKGMEQGKLVLWVDIFPADMVNMPPKVDITPHPPVAMELRAIVWNVVDVMLDDKCLQIDRVSDLYVKGWMLCLEEDIQRTDIHYRSLNGEGNFNWRFIFHFNYVPVERRMSVMTSTNVCDLCPEERKVQCKLEIQVWNNDPFGDDFLGTLILELCSMPCGAKIPSRCTLKMLAPNAGTVNLFKIKKTRGWWPFKRLKVTETVDNDFELSGKIELDLEILTEEEARECPAGLGREEPHPLPCPNRTFASKNPVNLNLTVPYRKNTSKNCTYVAILVVIFLIFFIIVMCLSKILK